MNKERVNELKALVAEEPGDPFCAYALALEYASDTAYVQEALTLLSELLKSHPEYLPAYYQTAVLLKAVGENEKAVEILQAGIQWAIQQKNFHTKSELEFLLDDLV